MIRAISGMREDMGNMKRELRTEMMMLKAEVAGIKDEIR